MSTITMFWVTLVACWTVSVCFALLLCAAARAGDQADHAHGYAGGSVEDALASLTTQP